MKLPRQVRYVIQGQPYELPEWRFSSSHATFEEALSQFRHWKWKIEAGTSHYEFVRIARIESDEEVMRCSSPAENKGT